MSYRISPDVFFLVEDDRLLVWNCKTHQQYLLDPEYTQALLNVNNIDQANRDVFQQLQTAGIVIHTNSLDHTWGWDCLSYLFHRGTQDIPADATPSDADEYAKQYLDQCQSLVEQPPAWFQTKTEQPIDLPPPNLYHLNKGYGEVLQQRITSRQFYSTPINQQQLSDLLYSSFGLIHGDWQCDDNSGIHVAGIRKASPSSGGLHAEEAYIVIYRVDGMQPGLYYYRPQDHKLDMIEAGNFEQQNIHWNRGQYFSKGMAVGIYLCARLDKYWWKYPHSRSYRIMLMDIGHVSQTFLLNATALGLQTWLTGAFQDSEIEQFLRLDRQRESVMLFVGAGHGNPDGLPANFRQQDSHPL